MKKILKRMAILTVCVFAFAVVGSVCLKPTFEARKTVDAKVILPEPVRNGGVEEGILIG